MNNREFAADATTAHRSSQQELYRQTLFAVAAAGVALLLADIYAASVAALGIIGALTSIGVYTVAGKIIVSRILSFHPYKAFGWPNAVTLTRTVLAAIIAGYTAEISLWTVSPSTPLAWTFAILASCAVALDGLDGWLARKLGPQSAFGARFDMESDAMLILVLSILASVLGKTGAWILAIGAIRYAFLAASFLWNWLDRPLFASRRRKAVCAFQGIALSLLAMPPVSGRMALLLAFSALTLTFWSFAIDIAWLYRHRATVAPGK